MQINQHLTLLPFCILHFIFCLSSFAQGTAFTYQGRLNDGASPANGIYDLRFTIYDLPGGGTPQAASLTNSATAVSNGLFAVTLDFGADVFDGAERWLEVGVRSNGTGSFTALSPRQPLTPSPYAIYAGGANAEGLTGTLPSAQLTGKYLQDVSFDNAGNSFTGNGAGLIALNASELVSGTVPDARLDANIARLNTGAIFQGTVRALGDLAGHRLNVGTNHLLTGLLSSITSGERNTNQAPFSAIGSGQWNTIDASVGWSFIGGGFNNRIGTDAYAGVIGGGEENSIANEVSFGVIAGGAVNGIGVGSERSAIGGGDHNSIAGNAPYSTIAGGRLNSVGTNSERSVIGGGHGNNIAGNSLYAAIAGGAGNSISSNTIGSTIGGGENNEIGNSTLYAVIAGGVEQTIGTNSGSAAIGGGEANTVTSNGYFATIPGGVNNLATAYAFAAGANARATNQGAFVWSDSTGTITRSTNNNSVTMRASGGFRFFTGTGTNGAQLLPGATAWSVLSDRNLKKDFQSVDTQLILEKLARVSVMQWRYLWENESDPPNLGPTAQAFKSEFYPGRDDKSISTLEFDGVALAAIQGLNQKLNEKDLEIRRLQQQNNSLEKRLDRLEKLLASSASGN